MFFEMQLAAENVAAPLGPDMNPVLSRITIHARGNGFEDISRSLGLGILGPLSADQQGDISDGERFNVEAFFDITYDIEFTDMDPDEDYDADFSSPASKWRPEFGAFRIPRTQRSTTATLHLHGRLRIRRHLPRLDWFPSQDASNCVCPETRARGLRLRGSASRTLLVRTSVVFPNWWTLATHS